MKRAAIYCRISSDPAHDELGVRRQQADCEALAEKAGYQVVAVLVDDDRSAYSGKARPQFKELMRLLAAKQIDVVLAWHPDRLTRHPRELEDLIDALEAARTTVRTVQSGEYDLGTATGRMTARIVGAVARGESEHKADRLRRKHRDLAEKGMVSGGGTRPFGFEDDRVTVRRSEAKVIREVTDRVLGGASVRSVVADLNRRKIGTVSGKPWTQTTMRRMLSSGRIAGLRVHHTGTYPAAWQAIITPEQHNRLVALFADPNRSKVKGGERRYLLTGLLVCGACGARLVARPRDDKRRCYVCASGPSFTGCGKIRVLSEPLEELVVEAVLERLDTPELCQFIETNQRPTTDSDADLEALRVLDGRMSELAAMWAAGELDRTSWAAARDRLTADRERIQQQLRTTVPTSLDVYSATDGTLRRRWPKLDRDAQRSIIAAVIDSVTVGPAVRGRNYFDPGRVTVDWRA